MALDNHTVEVELIQWARDIARQYELGNNSTARTMFKQIPEHRKAFVTYLMTVYSIREGDMPLADLDRFIRSVTE